MTATLPLVGVPRPMTRRLAAVVLAGQAPVVLFGALALWGLASAQQDARAGLFLGLGLGLTVLCVVAAGLLRRPFGVTLGWVVQLGTFAAAIVAPVAAIVGIVFGGLWITALVQGRKMDDLTAAHERATASRARPTG